MKTMQSNPIIELPPREFSNAINDLDPSFDYQNWRRSREWKLFVVGYNAAIRKANDQIMSQYDMGMNAEKLFGRR